MDLRVFTEPQQGATYDDLLAVARTAEELGYGAFFRSDHYLAMGTDGHPGPTDAWTTLAGLARETSTIRLGTLVSSMTFRLPGMLAVQVAQVDAMSAHGGSGGRVELGLGTGWFDREHTAYGVPFPPLAERFERLEETIQICNQMYSDDNGPFRGRHYQLAETLCVPKPLGRPAVPLMIGGGGEKKTLRLVARYAQACNLFPDEGLERKLDVLRGHCEEVGRDYDEIEKTVMGPLDPSDPPALVARLAELAALGVQEYHGMVPGVAELEPLRVLGKEVVPAVADL